ncbi:MAG: haloacid dehalogenase-like hydrolase [Bacteroidales bacterium]|nr:haloacid dehalogenase-like hydrolase [Bacteroidales bacterium]
MKRKQSNVAIAYDFDGTLAPGNMQEHSFIPNLGVSKTSFWKESNQVARDNDGDEILTYLQLMIKKAKEKNIPITRKAFMEHGRKIQYFEGVDTFFDRINDFAKGQQVRIDHYIISSGVRDIIKGTSIAKYFTYIFASGYIFDATGVATWPALAINYTTKTQYLFRINKGILNSYDNSQINRFVDYDKRPLPFPQIIYIGDGETDVPAMKMVKHQGGTSIAVYDPSKRKRKDKPSPKQICEQLIRDQRADFIAPADYTEGSRLEKLVKSLIIKIKSEDDLMNYK